MKTPEINTAEDMALSAKLSRTLEIEAQTLIPSIQAGIDTENNQQKLVDIMLEIETLKGNL